MFSLKQKFLPLSALKSSSLNIITTHDGSAPGGGPPPGGGPANGGAAATG